MKRKLVNFIKVASFIGAMCIGICAIEGMCIPLMSVWIYVFIFLYAQKEKPCDGVHKTSEKLKQDILFDEKYIILERKAQEVEK